MWITTWFCGHPKFLPKLQSFEEILASSKNIFFSSPFIGISLCFSCATDFSLCEQADLYIAIHYVLLGRGLLWTKQPGLSALWAAHDLFCSWGLSIRELLYPFKFYISNPPSPVLCIPQPQCLPNTVGFWALPWLWAEILRRQSNHAVTSGQKAGNEGNPMWWGRKVMQRVKPVHCKNDWVVGAQVRDLLGRLECKVQIWEHDISHCQWYIYCGRRK